MNLRQGEVFLERSLTATSLRKLKIIFQVSRQVSHNFTVDFLADSEVLSWMTVADFFSFSSFHQKYLNLHDSCFWFMGNRCNFHFSLLRQFVYFTWKNCQDMMNRKKVPSFKNFFENHMIRSFFADFMPRNCLRIRASLVFLKRTKFKLGQLGCKDGG